jgi:hypothetical protein
MAAQGSRAPLLETPPARSHRWALARQRERIAGMEPMPSAPVPAHRASCRPAQEERPMNGIIYLVGLIVVIMFILSFLGLR